LEDAGVETQRFLAGLEIDMGDGKGGALAHDLEEGAFAHFAQTKKSLGTPVDERFQEVMRALFTTKEVEAVGDGVADVEEVALAADEAADVQLEGTLLLLLNARLLHQAIINWHYLNALGAQGANGDPAAVAGRVVNQSKDEHGIGSRGLVYSLPGGGTQVGDGSLAQFLVGEKAGIDGASKLALPYRRRRHTEERERISHRLHVKAGGGEEVTGGGEKRMFGTHLFGDLRESDVSSMGLENAVAAQFERANETSILG
jgi:hypothetical protein